MIFRAIGAWFMGPVRKFVKDRPYIAVVLLLVAVCVILNWKLGNARETIGDLEAELTTVRANLKTSEANYSVCEDTNQAHEDVIEEINQNALSEVRKSDQLLELKEQTDRLRDLFEQEIARLLAEANEEKFNEDCAAFDDFLVCPDLSDWLWGDRTCTTGSC